MDVLLHCKLQIAHDEEMLMDSLRVLIGCLKRVEKKRTE